MPDKFFQPSENRAFPSGIRGWLPVAATLFGPGNPRPELRAEPSAAPAQPFPSLGTVRTAQSERHAATPSAENVEFPSPLPVPLQTGFSCSGPTKRPRLPAPAARRQRQERAKRPRLSCSASFGGAQNHSLRGRHEKQPLLRPFPVPSRSLPHLFPASANRLQPVPHTSPPKERTFAAGCCVPHDPQTPPAATGRSPRFTPAKACPAPPEQLATIQCNSGKPPIMPAAPKFATGRAPQPKRNVRRLCAAANGRPRLRIVRTRRHIRRQREPPSETASKRRHEHSDI